MEQCDEYVQRLEQVAQEMTLALEQALSLIDKERFALVNPDYAKKKIGDCLDAYHGLMRDYSGD